MRFTELELPGVFLIEPEPRHDERGFFTRWFCRDEFVAHGLNPDVAQCAVAHNEHTDTLRGMHYQFAPWEETKLVRCTRGAIFHVIVDLRPAEATFRRWRSISLTAADDHAVYIPPGFANGYLTLEPQSEVTYQIATPYHAEAARGVRWDDPAFGIEWPRPPAVMSERDRTFPDFE